MTNAHIFFMGLVVVSMAACTGLNVYLVMVKMPEDRRIDRINRENQDRYQRAHAREIALHVGKMLLGLHWRNQSMIQEAITAINAKSQAEMQALRGGHPQAVSRPRGGTGILASPGR